MRLRELFEAKSKIAVVAFGRMNPPTIGHAKLVDKVKSVSGDPYIFLSQSQKPKTDPLPFADKLRYAKFFFPEVTIGNPEVRTPIQMMQYLEGLGYTDIIYVAGSDRVPAFDKLFNDYNGKDYNFNSIQVVSAGERDPDADGAEGMSASKMRAAAAEGNLESFKQGVPRQEVADEMFAAVRKGMGISEDANLEENNLTELFDNPYPYTLDIGSDKATARISLPDGTNLRVGFLKSKTKWDMAFDRDGTFDADDQGDQFKVMATVVAVFKDFVEKVKPEKITFDADQDSTNSRVDVYAKMLNRYADKMGYGFTAKNPEGDSIIQYTLTKGKSNVKNTDQPQKDVPATKTSSNFSIKKIEGTMWDEFRIFNLHKAGKVDLVDAIAKLSPEEQEWAKLRWGQGLRLGEIGKKYNMSNSQAIEKYKTIHDKIRQHLELKDITAENASSDEEDEFHRKLDKLVHKTFGHSSDEKKKKKYEEETLSEFDVRNSKKYSKADTYKGYEIYISVEPVLQGQHMAVAYDRAGKEAFRGKGRVPEQAANMIKDTIDGRQNTATKVEGNATIDFNAQFSREILEPGMEKIYAKIVAGPKLIVANSTYYDDTDALVQMGFKPTAFRTKEGLLAIGMTARQTQGAELIANGRYYVGDKSYDEFENSVYDLDFHSVVNDKNEKYSLGKPGLTVATRRT